MFIVNKETELLHWEIETKIVKNKALITHFAQTTIGTYHILKNGLILLSDIDETHIKNQLCKVSKNFSQNDSCGVYDQLMLEKALCQYHFIKNTFYSATLLKWSVDGSDFDDVYGILDQDYLVADSEFGMFSLQNNGRIMFTPRDEYHIKIGAKRLAHIPPNNQILGKEYLYNEEDIKKAICQEYLLKLRTKYSNQ